MRTVIWFLPIQGSFMVTNTGASIQGKSLQIQTSCHVFVCIIDDKITDKKILNQILMKDF